MVMKYKGGGKTKVSTMGGGQGAGMHRMADCPMCGMKHGGSCKLATGGSIASRVSKLEAHERAEGKMQEQMAKSHAKMQEGGRVTKSTPIPKTQPGNSNGIRQRKNLAMGKG